MGEKISTIESTGNFERAHCLVRVGEQLFISQTEDADLRDFVEALSPTPKRVNFFGVIHGVKSSGTYYYKLLVLDPDGQWTTDVQHYDDEAWKTVVALQKKGILVGL